MLNGSEPMQGSADGDSIVSSTFGLRWICRVVGVTRAECSAVESSWMPRRSGAVRIVGFGFVKLLGLMVVKGDGMRWFNCNFDKLACLEWIHWITGSGTLT